MRLVVLPSLWVLVSIACSGSPTPSAPESHPTTPSQAQPVSDDPPSSDPSATPDFRSGNMRCMHVIPETGELTSCEQISEAGLGQQSAVDNCEMLSAQLEEGTCPSDSWVGRCLAMDGPQLTPVYPILIHYYRSNHVPTAERAAELCSMLSGTFIPVP